MNITNKLRSLLLLIVFAIPTASAQIQVLAVTDAATFSTTSLAWGSLATVFCTGLTGIDGIQRATQYPLPYEIAGVSVRLNGDSAPLLAVADLGGYQQINIQWPGSSYGTVEVSQSGDVGSLHPQFLDLPWGVFFTDSSGHAIVQHADYSLVTPDHPAQPGEIVIAYGTNLTDFSQVPNQPQLGVPTPSDYPRFVYAPSSNGITWIVPYVTVNGKQAKMLFVGLASGLVGVYQINFVVPAEAQDGDAMVNAVRGLCLTSGCVPENLVTSLEAKLPVRASAPQQ